jgi:hypothetical protein
MRTLRRLCALGVVVALALPAPAGADFRTLYDDYSSDGQIEGCDYEPSELTSSLGEIPADVREYDPAFSEALNTALEQLAAGCESSLEDTELAGGSTAEDGSPGPSIPRAVSPEVAPDGGGLPAVLLALIAVARRYGWDLPRGGPGAARGRLARGLWAVRDRLGF